MSKATKDRIPRKRKKYIKKLIHEAVVTGKRTVPPPSKKKKRNETDI